MLSQRLKFAYDAHHRLVLHYYSPCLFVPHWLKPKGFVRRAQLCINTACVYLRRFYCFVDLKTFQRHVSSSCVIHTFFFFYSCLAHMFPCVVNMRVDRYSSVVWKKNGGCGLKWFAFSFGIAITYLVTFQLLIACFVITLCFITFKCGLKKNLNKVTIPFIFKV